VLADQEGELVAEFGLASAGAGTRGLSARGPGTLAFRERTLDAQSGNKPPSSASAQPASAGLSDEIVRKLQTVRRDLEDPSSIGNDENYWEQLETYVSEHGEASFSHGICPNC